jgi:acyl-coenzyme A synthetase/AMP-(fatty) acid ligase
MKMADNYLFDGLLAGKLDSEDRRNALFATLPDDGRRYSYGDVEDVSGRFANRLVDLGVKPGDRVAVQVPKSIEAMMLYLRRGPRRSCLPAAEHRYTAAEIEYFLGNAEPSVFVCDPKDAELQAIGRQAGHHAGDHGRVEKPRRVCRHTCSRQACKPHRTSPVWIAARKTSRPFSTRQAPPGAPRVRCSAMTTCCRMPSC